MNLVRWTNAAKWRDNVERSVNETLVKVGKLGSRVAINEGGIDQLGRDLGSFKQQMDSNYSKVAEQLKNLRLEFKVNLSVVANVTENVTTTTINEDKPNGNGHRLSISVGSTLGLIFLIISNTNL